MKKKWHTFGKISEMRSRCFHLFSWILQKVKVNYLQWSIQNKSFAIMLLLSLFIVAVALKMLKFSYLPMWATLVKTTDILFFIIIWSCYTCCNHEVHLISDKGSIDGENERNGAPYRWHLDRWMALRAKDHFLFYQVLSFSCMSQFSSDTISKISKSICLKTLPGSKRRGR